MSDAECMWMYNALAYRGNQDNTSAADFGLLEERWLHDVPVREMPVSLLLDTLEGLVWRLDGDLVSKIERTPAWYAACAELLELCRARAYYLATHALPPEVVDMPEYVHRRHAAVAVSYAREDGDVERADFLDEAAIERLAEVERGREVQTGTAFAWDFCAMLTHADVILRGLERLVVVDHARPAVLALRRRVLANVALPSMLGAFCTFRTEYEHALACNAADLRIYRRRAPLDNNPKPRAVLALKRQGLVNDKLTPRTFDAMFTGVTKEVYELNTDAALCFYAAQKHDDVVRKLILKDWEYGGVVELEAPRILYVRAGRFWAVVERFPHVVRCDSLCAAYEYLTTLVGEAVFPGDELTRQPKRVRLNI